MLCSLRGHLQVGIDLIYEGITTLTAQRDDIQFDLAVGIDLIYEGITTLPILQPLIVWLQNRWN